MIGRSPEMPAALVPFSRVTCWGFVSTTPEISRRQPISGAAAHPAWGGTLLFPVPVPASATGSRSRCIHGHYVPNEFMDVRRTVSTVAAIAGREKAPLPARRTGVPTAGCPLVRAVGVRACPLLPTLGEKGGEGLGMRECWKGAHLTNPALAR